MKEKEFLLKVFILVAFSPCLVPVHTEVVIVYGVFQV